MKSQAGSEVIPQEGDGGDVLDEKALDDILRATGALKSRATDESQRFEEHGVSAPEGQAKPAPTVTISPDGMTASITLPAITGGYSQEELQDALDHAGVVYGVDWPRLHELAVRGTSGRLIPIAQGTPPISGKDAHIEYLFDLASGELQEHGGRVNWHELHLIHSVEAGAPLARKHPPQPGQPGTNVRGQPVNPKLPQDRRVPYGHGVGSSPDDPTLVIATVAGAVRIDADGRLAVDETYVVTGDVDLSTGDIDIDGSVVIKHDVKQGFTIKATGDVEVNGLVEEAQIIAGGSFIAKGGVLGGGRASIQAGNDILARFANNARLIAGHDVVLALEVINCDVEAEGRVMVGGKEPTKGVIRGGSVQACQEVVAHTVGALNGAKTRLRAGYDWLLPRKLESVDLELMHRRAQLEKTQARLKELTAERAHGPLSTNKGMLLEKLRLADEALRVAVRTLENRRTNWLKVANTKGSITVHGTAYPGTEFTVDGHVRQITEERRGERFLAEGDMVIGLTAKTGLSGWDRLGPAGQG